MEVEVLDTLSLNCQDIDLSTEDYLIKMKRLEQAYWYYIDHIMMKTHKKPNFVQFLHDLKIKNADLKFKQYSKYKKSLPTAGIIILNQDSNTYMLCVRISGNVLYSIPKGKITDIRNGCRF